MSRKHTAHAFGLLLSLSLAGCDAARDERGGSAAASKPVAPFEEIAVIRMQGGGAIRLRFFRDQAPNHVKNFKRLAREGFYDGTTFHRVIPGFMIQGGDPNTKDDDPRNDGLGRPGYTIRAEFNEIPHRRGILSMARANDPHSAGSQFFIMVADSPSWKQVLDGKYTVFGEVISGMHVVDRIVAVPRDGRDRPRRDQVMESVTIQVVK